MVNIKNYTSTVPAGSSQVKIESYLVEAGASDISKKYDPETKVCVAITFRIFHTSEQYPAGIAMFFKLPAKVEACFKVLYGEVKRPRPDTKKLVMQQAERTTWKIISDWVEVQLSMIRLEQAEMLQVFLPYAYDAATDKTFFEKMKDTDFKALGPAK